MKIEIITTKKKLTKSIVNQMREAARPQLKDGTAIGYLINVREKVYKAILLKCGNEYFIIPSNYKKGKLSVYREIGKRSQNIYFESEELCDSWWELYQARTREAVKQIYV